MLPIISQMSVRVQKEILMKEYYNTQQSTNIYEDNWHNVD